MQRSFVCVVIALLGLIGTEAAVAAPPKVVDAKPDNGAVNVDPTLKEIRVKFDQPMEKGMSVVGGGEQFPEIVGKPTWADDQTIVIKVKLKPNHDYWLSINNASFQNFTNRAGESSTPYPIKFRTGRVKSAKKGADVADSAGAASSADAKVNRRAYNLLRNAVRDKYSYRDRLAIDWDKLFESIEPSLVDATTPDEFARAAGAALAQAKDKHIWFQVGEETIPTYVNPSVVNANYKLLPTLVPGLNRHNKALVSGRWPDGIGYIAIAGWDEKKLGDISQVLDVLKGLSDTKALVVDVRANGGGAEPLAQQFAGCFVSEPRLYGKDVFRDSSRPSGFTEPKERWVKPNPNYPKYKGRVVVLSGPAVMSSCESFLLMMKQNPETKIVGARSQGSSGNPKPLDLGNGVTIFLPSWKDMTADGKELEGIGIAPDIEVNASANDFKEADPVLNAALQHLRSASSK